MSQPSAYEDRPWLDPEAEPFIKVQSVSKHFGDFTAVDSVDLDIYKGELFCLLGGSGCGKSTLLRMLAGFETPSSGSIIIDGVNMNDVPPFERPVNMMFQSYALFPHMTVETNVAYGLKRDGVAKDEINQRVEEMLAMDELTLPHYSAYFGDVWVTLTASNRAGLSAVSPSSSVAVPPLDVGDGVVGWGQGVGLQSLFNASFTISGFNSGAAPITLFTYCVSSQPFAVYDILPCVSEPSASLACASSSRRSAPSRSSSALCATANARCVALVSSGAAAAIAESVR